MLPLPLLGPFLMTTQYVVVYFQFCFAVDLMSTHNRPYLIVMQYMTLRSKGQGQGHRTAAAAGVGLRVERTVWFLGNI